MCNSHLNQFSPHQIKYESVSDITPSTSAKAEPPRIWYASVVYHYDTIDKKYPQHPVLQSTVANESLRLKLKSLLATDFLDFNSKSLNRTGIDKKARKKEWRDRKMFAAANNENVSNGNYTWPDRMCSPIPPDFAFPQCNFRKKVIAFKDLTSSMFKTLKNERKKYSTRSRLVNKTIDKVVQHEIKGNGAPARDARALEFEEFKEVVRVARTKVLMMIGIPSRKTNCIYGTEF